MVSFSCTISLKMMTFLEYVSVSKVTTFNISYEGY